MNLISRFWTPAVKRWLIRGAELLLVLVILALLALIWLPVFIGSRPGSLR